MEGRRDLEWMCIEAATANRESVETWRRQRRTLERLPFHLAGALLRRLHHRRLLYPSLLEVFQHSVEEIDLKGESCVDAEWMVYLGAFRYLCSLNIAGCRGIDNSGLWPVTGMNNLKELDLSRCSKITDAGIRHLLSISNLEKLWLSETGMTAEGVKLLSSLRNLRLLDMGGIPITDMALRSLLVLTELEYLDIWGSEVSNVGADILNMFRRLTFLNLAWTNVTKLPYLPSITSLNMSNCKIDNIFYEDLGNKATLSKLHLLGATIENDDEAFSNLEMGYITFLDLSRSTVSNFVFLSKMEKLEHLDLSFSKVTDDFINHVASAGVNLRYLNLSNTKITSHAICILVGHVMNLETLLLSHTMVDDMALPYIGMMPSLGQIDLSHTRVIGFYYPAGKSSDIVFSLNALLNLNHLESLNLENTKLRDEALFPLISMRELKHLYLKSELFSDFSLHALLSLRNLTSLGFRCAVVSDFWLLSYRPPSMLRLLDLRGCWLLTERSLSLFCKIYPGLEVRHEHLQMLPEDQSASVLPFPSNKMMKGSELKQKGVKLSQGPSRNPNRTFIDERIKYSREELLDLQLLSLSSLSLSDSTVPAELRKE